MVDDPALRVESTHAGAGVHAVLADAGEAGHAVRVDHALWPAARVRVAEVLWPAAADAGAAAHAGVSIGTARVRVARVSGRRRSYK